jgi:glycerol-3-phosphate dehydrogenase
LKKFETEILIIGGGATGTGIARDLAMRGFQIMLVEKNDFAQGTTGRFHGLLHSGGRYVVSDPQTAQECIEENLILRKIMPHCIEDTGGFFVLTDYDDPGYVSLFQSGCERVGIPLEEMNIGQMLREEPLLNPKISRGFRVPDGSADSFLATELNAYSAREYNAEILNYHEIIDLISSKDRITAALCRDLYKNEDVQIRADVIVNASGAWVGKIAKLAAIDVKMIPGKGTMIALNHRIVNSVINRCRIPSNGDILVPAHTVAIMGTTDTPVQDPDDFVIEPWEIELLLEEGEMLIPGFKEMRILRSWAGVRPLHQETDSYDNREISRSFTLLDHHSRDGIDGLITITGGKWTTYRRMAEAASDLVCRKLGVERACRTHLEQLPESFERTSVRARTYHQSGERLSEIEKRQGFGELICECELVTEQEVVKAILKESVKTIDDVRREVRLGMGPCQGGFCSYRVSGLMHRLRSYPPQRTNIALKEFLQERWKGLLPVLWGDQLRQERFDELIYLNNFSISHLPGIQIESINRELYRDNHRKSASDKVNSYDIPPRHKSNDSNKSERTPDVLIIGAGLSGLVAANKAAEEGLKVRLIASGWGSLFWQTGCIDILGHNPEDPGSIAISPHESILRLKKGNRNHPYAHVDISSIEKAIEMLQIKCEAAGYPMHGSLVRNMLLPTAFGAARPTCLSPETMIAGDLSNNDPILVIGFEGYVDFYPELIADNIEALGIPTRSIRLDLPSLRTRRFINSRSLADLFETRAFQVEVIKEIKRQLTTLTGFRSARIAFPAVLGIREPVQIKASLEEELGNPVFEIPTLPPSIPGIRLHNILTRSIELNGGQVHNGMSVIRSQVKANHVDAVYSEAAARVLEHSAKKFVLATGGILGGGLITDFEGKVREPIFNLPVDYPADQKDWFHNQFLSKQGHPIFQVGIRTDKNFRVIGKSGDVRYENLVAIGNSLLGFDSIRERSREGIDLITGYFVGKNL